MENGDEMNKIIMRKIGKILVYSGFLSLEIQYVLFVAWALSILQVRQTVLKQIGFNFFMIGIFGIALFSTLVSAYLLQEIWNTIGEKKLKHEGE